MTLQQLAMPCSHWAANELARSQVRSASSRAIDCDNRNDAKILAKRYDTCSWIDANCACYRMFERCLSALPNWVGEQFQRG